MPLKPEDFDGEKFAKKYNLDPFTDFRDDGKGNIICPSLPNLTDADLLDCIVDPPSPFIKFDKPVLAPDFIVATPPINPDPEQALLDAIAEMEKGEGSPKSLYIMLGGVTKYLKSKKDKLK